MGPKLSARYPDTGVVWRRAMQMKEVCQEVSQPSLSTLPVVRTVRSRDSDNIDQFANVPLQANIDLEPLLFICVCSAT